MSSILRKTIGGLSKIYYFRQLFFSIVICGIIYLLFSSQGEALPNQFLIFMIINAPLYPYSRYIYETVVDFIMGENIFIINAIFMMMAKLFTMLMCWFFAIFIAPIGLVYLYVHHSKQEENQS